MPAFERLGHDLARLDAAPELVERSRRAARDEVRHARQCADLAAGYRGVVATPLALPCPTGPAAGWAEVVSDSWRDGCLGEGAAARRAERARAGARDELVRAVQGAIAVDEANHAELAWSVMAEGLRRGGSAVRDGLAAELDRAAAPPAGMHAIDDEAARAHGRLSPRDAELAWIETHERGLPRARALLDAASAAAGRRS
ncbi:MAG: hypothetical protein U1F43_19425 [Myxococcota bacterium]